ncbi:hypothetical protein PG996_015499 [Apiospora saccharicola]|uniref:Uncharacterized protein n=1 Tax=Apiospora saccharicola TaxID=335842 RepID=A0ABR1TNF4_9PEZI
MPQDTQEYSAESKPSSRQSQICQGSMPAVGPVISSGQVLESRHPESRTSADDGSLADQRRGRTAHECSNSKSTCIDIAAEELREKSPSSLPSDTPCNPKVTASKFHTLRLQLAAIVACLALLAFVITYVQATYNAQWSSQNGLQLSNLLKTKASTILAVLRTSQGLLSMLTTVALDGSFTILHWNSMAFPQGLLYPTLLSLSPTTSAWGVFGIIKSNTPSLSTKSLATLRLTIPAFVWVSGLVLFLLTRSVQVNTSSVTVYDTAFAYPVTAGVGRFNGSLVDPFKTFLHTLRPGYPYETIPYNYLASAYTLVVNPLLATVADPRRCTIEPCISYLLSGGLTTVIPWVPKDHADYSLVRVRHAPSIQADFTGPLAKNISFHSDDCDIFGQNDITIGIRLCLKRNPLDSSQLMAGMFVCPKGIAKGACAANKPAPNITTQVAFHSLQASFVSSRKNYTVTSIEDTTRQLSDPTTWGILEQNFQSILVFPFWLFNVHNWGNTQIKENETISTLPPEFYTEASLVEPYVKLRVDKGMFALFLTFQILAILFVSGVVVWVWLSKGPARKPSSFPLFDIVFRAQVRGGANLKCSPDISDSDIISGLEDTRVAAA